MNKCYLYMGKVLYVKSYRAVNSTCFAVFFRDRKGYERRFTLNKELEVYYSEAEAQRALDLFAEARKLEETTDSAGECEVKAI